MYPICYPFYHEVSARQEVWQRLSVLRATQVKIRSKTQLFLEGGQLLQVDRPTTTSFQEDSSSREFVRLQKCNLLTEGFSCLLRLLLYIVRYVIVHYVTAQRVWRFLFWGSHVRDHCNGRCVFRGRILQLVAGRV